VEQAEQLVGLVVLAVEVELALEKVVEVVVDFWLASVFDRVEQQQFSEKAKLSEELPLLHLP